MDAGTFKQLVNTGEGNTLELKRSVPHNTGETICAFANTEGGHLIIGVEKDRSFFGLKASELDALQQKIAGSYKVCDPRPLVQIETVTLDEKHFLIVSVARLGEGVCYYGSEIILRLGSTNHRITGPTIEEFLRKRRIINFDSSRSKAGINDIDTAAVQKFMSLRTPNYNVEEAKIKELLLSLNAAITNGEFYLKNAGVLLFALNPNSFTPQNALKLARYKGKTPVDIMEVVVLKENLVENLNHAISFIKRNTSTSYEIKGLVRKEKVEYPEVAIREALVNALVHRDYFDAAAIQVNIFDDRLEIVNPGFLPSGVTAEELPTLGLGAPRNPLLYQLLLDAGYVEGLGSGIPRMIATMRSQGLPDPSFQQIGAFFKIILFNSFSHLDSSLNTRQRRCLIYLKDNTILTAPQYARIFNISHPQAVNDLRELIALDYVKKRGKGPVTAYTLAPEKSKK